MGYLRKALKVKLDRDDEAKKQFEIIADKLIAFDLLSREKCGQRSRESLEQIIERFFTDNLDQDSYSITKLLDVTTNAESIIVVFLGSLTPNELGKIKAFEADIKKRANNAEVLVMVHDLKGPVDFLKLL